MSLTAPHPLQNTREHFGAVAKALHWLTALLILTLIPLGLVAENWPHDTGAALATKATLFSIHKTLGLAAFFVALARILWALAQPRPAPLHPERRFETLAAETVHWLLYAALVLVPLSGWVHHAATTGFAPIWWPFGQTLPFVPQSARVADAAGALHGLFVWVLIGALLAHVGGALKHHILDRDAVLRRMLPGKPALPALAPARRHAAPVLAAFGLYGALALWAMTGAGEALPQPQASSVVATEGVGNWQVQEGQLEINVLQMGQPVTGSFAQWSATIQFDETLRDGAMGAVDVMIDVSSLSLGSVTSQALGPEFFDAETYSTARFRADIHLEGEAFRAEGTLDLVGQTVPVSLPFTLEIDGTQARMDGALGLDRRDFGMGETYPDERSVGFAVGVRVALTAIRLD